MDIAIVYNGNTFAFDLATQGVDLTTEDGLRTAIIVSLFTDRRAEVDDVLPGGVDDWRGWWADAFPAVERDRIGSRLWLLAREKQLAGVVERAREYAEEALRWLVADSIARAVRVTAEIVRDAQGGASAAGGRMPGAATGVLGLSIEIERPNGAASTYRFNQVWEAL